MAYTVSTFAVRYSGVGPNISSKTTALWAPGPASPRTPLARASTEVAGVRLTYASTPRANLSPR